MANEATEPKTEEKIKVEYTIQQANNAMALYQMAYKHPNAGFLEAGIAQELTQLIQAAAKVAEHNQQVAEKKEE